MKWLYPASHDISSLSDSNLAVKIARHSRCDECDDETCSGLRPRHDATVSLDNLQDDPVLGDLNQYGSDDEESKEYLHECACGHGPNAHGADPETLGKDEFARRGRVAVRLDELLEDAGKLLDFDYTDEDIIGLRRQMTLPESAESPDSDLSSTGKRLLSPDSSGHNSPPSKRRRISLSSLSDEDSDSDEEDKPLAQRLTANNAAKHTAANKANSNGGGGGRRVGKKTSGMTMKAKSSTAPALLPPPTVEEQVAMNNQTNGVNGHGPDAKVKVEDTMDEHQLDRLATGVTVDATTSGQPSTRAEKLAQVELRKGVIQITPVENDGQPRSLVILTNLKTLFQKQLPKMPREYIARLVYDYNSRCMAIIKRGYKVVGGICYRPFSHRGFAEIVFFATASVDQVKGYGGMLMDHFKTHIRQTYPDMWHFLTYADNYAVGYFKKQGFSKDITLPRWVWAGYIKDYEGGTIMQCTMVDKVDYLRTKEIVAEQREAILNKVRERSKSHVVYEGIKNWAEDVTLDPKDVPGLKESGWSPSMVTVTPRPAAKSPEYNSMRRLLSDLQGHPLAWAFLQPVNGDDVPDYYEIIKSPMDFSMMEHKLETNQYSDMDALVTDARLVFDNCRTYNPEDSVYYKNAGKLDKFVRDWLADRVRRED